MISILVLIVAVLLAIKALHELSKDDKAGLSDQAMRLAEKRRKSNGSRAPEPPKAGTPRSEN